MKTKIIIALCVSTLIGTSTFAETRKSTKSLMREVHSAFVKLLPYTTSQMKFTDVRFSKEITKNMSDLRDAFKSAHDNKQLKASLFSPTLKIVNKHLDKSLSAFSTHHKVYAYSKIRATKSLCLSCHAQLSKYAKTSVMQGQAKLRLKDFNDRYEYADYFFILRDYKNAIKNYELDMKSIVRDAYSTIDIGSVFDENRFFNSLKKIILIKTKIENKPNDLNKILNKYEKEKVLPKRIKTAIQSWKDDLKKLKKIPLNKFNIENEDELKNLLENYLRRRMSEDEIHYSSQIDLGIQVASGYLTRYLSSHHNSVKTAEILYWLSLAEKQLNRNHFFDIAEIYLVECIEKFPKSSFAKKCLNEYEDNLIFSYTGSAGTDVPINEQVELKRLKKLLK